MNQQDIMRMMQGMGSQEDSTPKPPLAEMGERVAMDVRLGDGTRNEDGVIVADVLDPRSPKSRRFGFLWANSKIDSLIKDGDVKNEKFISDLQFYLTHNPSREAQYKYISAIQHAGNISQDNKSQAIRLLCEYDFNPAAKNIHGETPAYVAVKMNDLKSLSALVQASAAGENKVLGFMDKDGNNLLNVAALHSPELIPFLLRSGLQSEFNNKGHNVVDSISQRFMSKVNFNPKDAFNDLYISLSSLQKANMLSTADMERMAPYFKNIDARYAPGLKHMLTQVSMIEPSDNIVLKNVPNMVSNMGYAVSYTGGIPITNTGFKFDLGASDLYRKATNSVLELFDVTSTYKGYKTLNFNNLDTDQLRINIEAIENSLNAKINKPSGFLARLAGSAVTPEEKAKYKTQLENLQTIKQMSATNSLEAARALNDMVIKLNAERIGQALSICQKNIASGAYDADKIHFDTIIQNNDHDTLLTYAVKNKHMDTINFCLAKNVNLHAADKDGNTALHLAARNGDLEVMNKLIGRFNGKSFEPVPPAKSVANINILNGEGKNFIDVLKESLPEDQYKTIMKQLSDKYPMIRDDMSWSIPYWDIDVAQRDAQLNNMSEDTPRIGMNRPELLEDAEWYKKPYPLGSAYTESEANEHYKDLQQTIMDISHSLKYDNVDKDTAKSMREALSSHLEQLPADKLMAMTIESMTSADKYREELKVINQELQSPNLSQDAKATLTKAQSEIDRFITLRNDIVEKVSNSIMSQLAEGPEERKEALYNSIDKYAAQTGGDVTKVLSGLSVLNTENPQHQQIFKNLQERVSHITAQKYAHLNKDDINDTPAPNNPRN